MSEKRSRTRPKREGNSREGTRAPGEDLTPQQLRGINALLSQPSIKAGADEIGVHPRTISRWLREPAFHAQYVAEMVHLQHELWRGMLRLRNDAWDRFRQLLESPDERIALRASTWALNQIMSVPAILNQTTIAVDAPAIPPALWAFLEQVDDPTKQEDQA